MKKEKIEFKLETKKGQIVYDIEVNVRSEMDMNKRTDYHRQGIFVKELKIVHQTNRKIALSDEYITILDRQRKGDRNDSYNHYLGDINVYVVTKENYFPNGIFCSCKTIIDPKKQLEKMKREIVNKIEKEYSWLGNVAQTIFDFDIIVE